MPRITEIHVGYAETVSLEGYYGNVRPSVGFTVALEDGENPDEVRSRFLEQAKRLVRAEIDAVLEEHDLPPKYYDGPRYKVLLIWTRNVVVVVPQGAVVSDHYSMLWERMRLQAARRKAEEYASEAGHQFVDCSDGNLGRLLPEESIAPSPGGL